MFPSALNQVTSLAEITKFFSSSNDAGELIFSYFKRSQPLETSFVQTKRVPININAVDSILHVKQRCYLHFKKQFIQSSLF